MTDLKTFFNVLAKEADEIQLKIKDFNISKINNLKFKKHKIPLAKTQVEAIKIINKNNFLKRRR